jgi:hypothetical protein
MKAILYYFVLFVAFGVFGQEMKVECLNGKLALTYSTTIGQTYVVSTTTNVNGQWTKNYQFANRNTGYFEAPTAGLTALYFKVEPAISYEKSEIDFVGWRFQVKIHCAYTNGTLTVNANNGIDWSRSWSIPLNPTNSVYNIVDDESLFVGYSGNLITFTATATSDSGEGSGAYLELAESLPMYHPLGNMWPKPTLFNSLFVLEGLEGNRTNLDKVFETLSSRMLTTIDNSFNIESEAWESSGFSYVDDEESWNKVVSCMGGDFSVPPTHVLLWTFRGNTNFTWSSLKGGYPTNRVSFLMLGGLNNPTNLVYELMGSRKYTGKEMMGFGLYPETAIFFKNLPISETDEDVDMNTFLWLQRFFSRATEKVGLSSSFAYTVRQAVEYASVLDNGASNPIASCVDWVGTLDRYLDQIVWEKGQ